jgi:hypothetical protein
MRTERVYVDSYDHNGEHIQTPMEVCVHENTEDIDEEYYRCLDCEEILDK